MFNQVFISYAKEDASFAYQLYSFLEQNQYSPWMDKKNLFPGQNWDLMINEALRRSDFIIVLLSKTSVAKRGYVQKEFNVALNYL